MKTPKPKGQPCPHCGLPVYDHEDWVGSKPKGALYWVYSHLNCADPRKEADKGVRLK